ncbi:MAG: DNA mismatch repair protein MutS [Bacteroidales bacterium]|nr:DNA mismatch repair protein MutS [Bacteroidales bacterium]
MAFKTCMNQNGGLRFIYDQLELQSSIGRKRMLNQRFITDSFALQMEIDILSEVIQWLEKDSSTTLIGNIGLNLHQINDIQQTISNLSNGQVLDDIQLFEIKKFAILSQNIVNELHKNNYFTLPFFDLNKVIEILDPENNKIAHFYIYSSYHPKLEEFRKNINQAASVQETEEWKWKALQLEDEIRAQLSKKLQVFHEELQKNLEQLAYLDMLIAKAKLAVTKRWCRPQLGNETTHFLQLYHPSVQAVLEKSEKKFQPIDIDLFNAPCLITGANMSGKTVLLKTIALAQFLFQFGFYLPAKEAVVMPVEHVLFSIGDQQSEMNGLSSFAVEILNINNIILNAKHGTIILALVDELARTTNPEEGKALVSAFISMMNKYKVNALITSHYSGITASCRRMRVKGLTLNKINEKINPNNLGDFMDYSLVETDTDQVPMEGLRIAEIFEIDEEFLMEAKKQIKHE